MIDHENDLQVVTNGHGILLGEDGFEAYCETENCQHPAIHRVVVSIRSPHDDVRDYCGSCYEAYTMGVAHGRFHEAALRGQLVIPGNTQQAPPFPVVPPASLSVALRPPPIRLDSLAGRVAAEPAAPEPKRLREADRANFKTLTRAFGANDTALVSVVRKQDKRNVALVCACDRSQGDIVFVPLAVMIEGDPYELFHPPIPELPNGEGSAPETRRNSRRQPRRSGRPGASRSIMSRRRPRPRQT